MGSESIFLVIRPINDSDPIYFKGGLELQGYEVGAPLPPQAPLSEAGRAEVKALLADLGALS